jgi:hypothetical protein
MSEPLQADKEPELLAIMRYTCQGNSFGDITVVPPIILLETNGVPFANPQTVSVKKKD